MVGFQLVCTGIGLMWVMFGPDGNPEVMFQRGARWTPETGWVGLDVSPEEREKARRRRTSRAERMKARQELAALEAEADRGTKP